tara:strand:- start:36 stop:227 length:192 start_codon:yes stop_codon:yes gene_type:complete
MGIFILLLVVCAVIIVAFQDRNITDDSGTPIEFEYTPLTIFSIICLIFVALIFIVGIISVITG